MESKYINTLLFTDNIFGKVETNTGRIIAFLLVSGSLPLGYIFFLPYIPFKLPLWCLITIVVLWVAYWFLIIIFRLSDKKKAYIEERDGNYGTISSFLHIINIDQDGLIQYDNGFISYLIYAEPKQFLDQNQLSLKLETFYNMLSRYNVMFRFYNDSDFDFIKQLDNLKEYKNETVISDRMAFFDKQLKVLSEDSMMLCHVYEVTAPIQKYNELKFDINEFVNSDAARAAFNHIAVCNDQQVAHWVSRDLYGYLDIEQELLDRYKVSSVYNSKIYFESDITIKPSTDLLGETDIGNRRAMN